MLHSRYLMAACLVLLGVGTRLLPYVLHALGQGNVHDASDMPWNVSPIGAICLFGGACLNNRRLAFALPLVIMLLGDVGMALLMADAWFGFPTIMPFTYGCLLLMVWLGTTLPRRLKESPSLVKRVVAVGGTALVGEIAFFLITNFANWVLQESLAPNEPPMYPYTVAGLIANYVGAIPFFGKSLMGTAVYGVAFFGGYALLQKPAQEAPAVLADAR